MIKSVHYHRLEMRNLNIKTNIENKIKNNTFLHYITLIALPSLVTVILLFVSFFYSFHNHKQIICNDALNSLKSYSAESENTINELISATSFFAKDETIKNILNNGINLSDKNSLSATKKSLNALTNMHSVILNSAIIDAKTNTVVSQNNTYTLEKYFTQLQVYESYPLEYWLNLMLIDAQNHRILPPTLMSSDEKNENIIPIIYKLKNSYPHTILIINVSLDKLFYRNLYQNTQNTDIFVLNRYNGQIFSKTSPLTNSFITDSPLYSKLLSDSNAFNSRFNNKKSFIVSYSTTTSLIGYTYFATIPYSDIYSLQKEYITFIFMMSILVIALSVFLSRNSAKIAIMPLKSILSTLKHTPVSKDIISELKNSINSLNNENSDLRLILPYAQESWLINYLNSSENDYNEVDNTIQKELPFVYDFFTAIIIQLFPTNELYNLYTSEEYRIIQNNFYDIVKAIFCTQFNTICLSSEEKSLYILLNLPSQDEEEKINKCIETITDSLKYDKELIRFFIGTGKIHKNMDGLRLSHKEALASLKYVPFETTEILLSDKTNRSINFYFSDKMENSLFNALTSLQKESAIQIIEEACSQNRFTDERSLKQLYSQIIIIILKVFRIKNLPAHDTLTEYEVSNEILSHTPKVIQQEIILLIDRLITNSDAKNNKSTGSNIVDFINENMNDNNLSLEMIASHFSSNAKTVSSMLKNTLNIGFHEYLSNLRIAKAKELLTNTEKSTQEICDEVGFGNKQTFFRVFKKIVGMTPFEYRNYNK